MNNPIALLNSALKISCVPVQLVKKRDGWKAFLPKKISSTGGVEIISDVAICDFGRQTKTALKLALCGRYHATAYENSDTVFIQTKHVLKCPNWFGRFGGLPEFAHYMKRAGLIK